MFEWHGWATISNTPAVDYFTDDPSPEILAVVRALVTASGGVDNETADLRVANGQYHLWLAGCHNHYDPDIIRLYRDIAAATPGSYGILYTFDSDASNDWERWVMRRGDIHREADHDLSPHAGLVEDPDDIEGTAEATEVESRGSVYGGSMVSPVWAREPSMSADRYWMLLSRLLKMAVHRRRLGTGAAVVVRSIVLLAPSR
jgi:hypothetical protein